MTDLDFENLAFGAKADDQVENLGQDEGVDDMTGDLYDTLRHRELLPLGMNSNAIRNFAQCDNFFANGWRFFDAAHQV
jgi:hypothetical protein